MADLDDVEFEDLLDADEDASPNSPGGLVGGCGPLGEGDDINKFISQVIDAVDSYIDDEKRAELLVCESLADLIESGVLKDTPDVIEPDNRKIEWIHEFNAVIWDKLKQKGINIEVETDE